MGRGKGSLPVVDAAARPAWARLRAAGRGLRLVSQPQACLGRQPSCSLRAAGRGHGQPLGAEWGRCAVARGETGTPWASTPAGGQLGGTRGTDGVSGQGRWNFLYSAPAGLHQTKAAFFQPDDVSSVLGTVLPQNTSTSSENCRVRAPIYLWARWRILGSSPKRSQTVTATNS